MSVKRRKKVTMEDIAKRLQISKNAVSLALNNKPGVSETLRKQVMETARQMNYGRFSALEENGSSCIAVLVPEYIRNDNYFYSDIFWTIEHEVRKSGNTVLMLGLSAKEEQDGIIPEVSNQLNVIGYITIGIIGSEFLTALCELGKPVISVDIRHNNIAIPTVGSDNFGGAYTATDYLIRSGHTRIGFIGPIHVAQSVYERLCGFRQAIMDARLPYNEEYCIFGSQDHFELLDSSQILNNYLSELTEYPTAWLCSGDLIAISLIGLLSEKNIRVPEDISVMGFDNLKVAEMVTPTLTTMHIDRNLMGKLAVTQLLEHIEKGCSHNYNLSLSCKLVVRDSVRRLSHQE
ncbi:MAG: LacI family DNA-binding transcriptional regulator [Caldicoprobacterales bacterium]|jgi:DNA-binding LacI/PurR family transcriptional regulator